MARGYTALFAFGWAALSGIARAESKTAEQVSLAETDFDALESLSLVDLFEIELKVVTATKEAVSLTKAPASMSVITAEDIELWGYRSVAEALRHMVGFYVIDDHIMPDAALRGVSSGLRSQSGLLKVMIDGQSVAFRQSSTNLLGPELIPISAVSRIEIIRGPASALYGADAFLGVINVITKSGREADQAKVRAAFLGGKDLRAGGSGEVLVGGEYGRLDYLAALSLDSENRSGLPLPGSSPLPRVPAYTTDLVSHEARRNGGSALLNLKYRLTDDMVVQSTGYLSGLDTATEFADWYQLVNGTDEQGREAIGRLSLVHGFARARLELNVLETLSFNVDTAVFAGGPTARDRVEVDSRTFYVRRQFGYRGLESRVGANWAPLAELSFVTEGSFSLDSEQLPSTEQVSKSNDTPNVAAEAEERVELQNVGYQVQGIYTPGWVPVSLTAGLRWDHNSVYGGQISGRTGVVLSPFDQLNIKLLYGNAFKSPSPLQLYSTPLVVGDIVGNDQLRPQYIDTFEAQVIYEPVRQLRLSTGVAYSIVDDSVQFTQRELNLTAANIATLDTLTWETEAVLNLRRVVRAYANATLQKTQRNLGEPGYRAQLFGSEGVVFPELVLHAGAAWVPRLPMTLGAEMTYAGPRASSDDNTLANGSRYYLPSYVQVDARAAYTGAELLRGKETLIELQVRNLFDLDLVDPGLGGVDYPLMPRTLWLQVSQEL